MGAPWTDCPPCPSCSLRTSITAYRDQGTMLAPWLWCPACGHRWEATARDREQAERAEAAWVAQQGGAP